MTEPLSHDLRARVLGAMEAGESCRSAADRFGVAASSAGKWHQRYRMKGLGDSWQEGRAPQGRLELHD